MSAPTRQLTTRLLRGGGPRDRRTHALAALAVAVAVTVILLTIGVNAALSGRDDRTAWLRPAAATNPVALQATSMTYLDGRPVTVVRLAELGQSDALPAPPGLGAFPRPGTAYLSPALADLLDQRPAANAWGRPTGALGRDGLIGPDQLAVVLGVANDDAGLRTPHWHNEISPADYSGPVPIRDFSGTPGASSSTERQYVSLGLVASVLLVVPVLTLVGAAARLGASRRADRLARLRLAGAPGRVVTGVAALESASVALIGGIAGTAGYAALLPLVRGVPVGGSSFATAQLWVGAGAVTAVAIGVVALCVGSALVPVRRILRDPLAVAQQHTTTLPVWWRFAAAVAAIALFWKATRQDGAEAVTVIGAFTALFGVLAVVGPVAVRILGAWQLRRARRRADAARLIAARRLIDDPRAGWRAVSGLVMASFVAGFLALFTPTSGQVVWGNANAYEVIVPAEQVDADVARATSALLQAGIESPVRAGDGNGALLAVSAPSSPTASVVVTLPADRERADRVRAVLVEAFPAAPAATGLDVAARDDVYASDFQRASFVVLLVTFLVAAASTGIVAAASVLDRRETWRRLWQAGTPLRVLARARFLESLSPVVVGSVIAMCVGLFAAAPVTLQQGGPGMAGTLLLLATLVIGRVAVGAAVRASGGALLRIAQS